MLVLGPYFLLALIASPLLVLTAPLAILIALIHHHALWAFVVIQVVIQAGGIADNVADLTILGELA